MTIRSQLLQINKHVGTSFNCSESFSVPKGKWYTIPSVLKLKYKIRYAWTTSQYDQIRSGYLAKSKLYCPWLPGWMILAFLYVGQYQSWSGCVSDQLPQLHSMASTSFSLSTHAHLLICHTRPHHGGQSSLHCPRAQGTKGTR